MGKLIRRPKEFQGFAIQEANHMNIPQGNVKTNDSSLNNKCITWNRSAEEYLAVLDNNIWEYYKGKYQPITFVTNTISAPQDNSE
eukprot:2007905-Heterocapsa_arctica.AAC.1